MCQGEVGAKGFSVEVTLGASEYVNSHQFICADVFCFLGPLWGVVLAFSGVKYVGKDVWEFTNSATQGCSLLC